MTKHRGIICHLNIYFQETQDMMWNSLWDGLDLWNTFQLFLKITCDFHAVLLNGSNKPKLITL